MLKDGLYHKDIYMPFIPARITGRLTISKHAERRSYEKGFIVPEFVSIHAEVIEFEVLRGQVVKILYRHTYDDRRDICMPVTVDKYVKTAWLNDKSDKHRTLDRSKYVARPR